MRNIFVWNTPRRTTKALCLFVLLLLAGQPARAKQLSASSILCRPNLAVSLRAELADKLRKITGWADLKFDESGALTFGEAESVGGSQTARDLLTAAVSGKTVIVLEDASNRSDVVFCRVIEGRWKHDAERKPPVYIVLIDFADFSHLMGEDAARAAFNVGWGVLHELDHIVHNSVDATMYGETGECEKLINQMRRECGLAERADYHYTFLPASLKSDFKSKLVRLPFDKYNPLTNKKKRYWLVWDATITGGLDERKQTAARM